MLLYLTLLCYPILVSCHCFLLAVEGSDGVRSTGFGVRLLTRGKLVQNTGIFAESDKTLGKTDRDLERRPGPCGRIYGGDSLPGFPIDTEKEMQIAEASGVPTTSDNGTIHIGVYVDNPDGAGPFKCFYSSNTSLTNFQPMKIVQQVEGLKGINKHANNFVYPLIAAFHENSTCDGGKNKNICIIKCTNPNQFGSCAAVKLPTGFGNNSNLNSSNLSSEIHSPSLTSGSSRGVRFGFG